MSYTLESRVSYGPKDIVAQRLKECAGGIIGRTLAMEHVPPGARELLDSGVTGPIIRTLFKDVVVECLAAYFDGLEDSREQVLGEIIATTQSRYGRRVRLLEAAVRRMRRAPDYDALQRLEERLTPEAYALCVAAVRTEYHERYGRPSPTHRS